MEFLRKVLFYDKMEGSRLCLALHWLINLAFMALFSLGIGIVSLYFGKVNYGPELFASYFRYALLFALNILPCLFLVLLFFLIFNRVWAGVLFGGLSVLILALINHFKLLFRSDPLVATDIGYALEAAQISAGYDIRITPAIALAFAGIIACTVFAALFMRAKLKKKPFRIAAPFLLMAMGLGLYFGPYSSEETYTFTSNMLVEFESGYKLNQWNETDLYCCRGFMYPLINSLKNLRSEKPEGYDRDETRAMLESLEGADIPEDKKVNIVAVMLEAYSDFSKLGLEFSTDPYEFFHELERESVSGELVTNIFAGGTIDTERCFISGSAQMFDYRAGADSYAHWFASQGYFTEFCHPGYAWFYNRRNVMEYLGFESLHFFEDRYQQPEGYEIMEDARFFADLRTLYEEAAGPYFNFSVSYQNHGPYAADYLYDEENEYVAQGSLSREAYNILNNYFWGIRQTDESLRGFIDSFRRDSEPVVIVLFGDHKPWLGDNSSVYAELGIDLSLGSDESFYNYYNTPYLIWANDAAKEALDNDFLGNGGSFSPCYLMLKLFELCGYEGDGYMQLLRECYEHLDVISQCSFARRYREPGSILSLEVSEEGKTALDRLYKAQYYRMRHWREEDGNG